MAWHFVKMARILVVWWCDLFLPEAGQEGVWKQAVLSFSLAGGSIPPPRSVLPKSLCCVHVSEQSEEQKLRKKEEGGHYLSNPRTICVIAFNQF